MLRPLAQLGEEPQQTRGSPASVAPKMPERDPCFLLRGVGSGAYRASSILGVGRERRDLFPSVWQSLCFWSCWVAYGRLETSMVSSPGQNREDGVPGLTLAWMSRAHLGTSPPPDPHPNWPWMRVHREPSCSTAPLRPLGHPYAQTSEPPALCPSLGDHLAMRNDPFGQCRPLTPAASWEPHFLPTLLLGRNGAHCLPSPSITEWSRALLAREAVSGEGPRRSFQQHTAATQ